MTPGLFTNLFSCSVTEKENCEEDLREIRERISRLEIKYDSLYEILRDIKMSIEVIKIRLESSVR